MPNTTGVIQNLETKDGIGKNDRPYKLYRLEIDSTWYSTFDESAGNYGPGDPVSFLYEERDNPNGPNPYRNITGFLAGPTREAAAEGFLDPPPAAPRRDPTRASIERQTAGKEVGGWVREFIAKGLITDFNSAVKHFVDNIEEVYQAIAGTVQKPEDARTEPETPQRGTDTLEGSDEPFPGGDEPW